MVSFSNLFFDVLLYHVCMYDSLCSLTSSFHRHWVSLLDHVCNQHEWIDGSCAHEPI